jgi:serine phosphatase RsbU (regulator of sigma subunit)/PAS domain-containing protein
MREKPDGIFAKAYLEGVGRHLKPGGDAGLAAAYELGRQALEEGLALLDVVQIHQAATHRLAAQGLSQDELSAADQFLLQSLTTFELAQRDFWEAQERVRVEEVIAEHFQAVAEASVAIIAHLRADDRVVELAEQARKVAGSASAAVRLNTDDGMFVGATGPVPDGVQEIAARVMATRTVQRSNSSGPEAPTALGIPMSARLVPNGVLVVWDRNEAFGASDEAALRQLASLGSVALANALLFEREHQIAVTLQTSLRPDDLPVLGGMDIAARYVPAAPGTQVGGDWYDVIELESGQVALVVGDVMGHGIKAASVMGQLRLALRAYAIDGYSPSEVVSRVDRLLERLDETQIATLVYAVLEPGFGKVTIVNAGHPPPLVVDPLGNPGLLTRAISVALGAGAGAAMENGRVVHKEEELTISPGSLFLLYTDGLVEDRNRPLGEGMAILERVARGHMGSPAELCDLVLSDVAPSRLEDDVCILAVTMK